jgi:hypothetical protein
MTRIMNPERTSDGAIDEHANTKPSLLIEIQLNDAPSRLREEEMEELVEKSLRTGFTCLSVGQVIDLSGCIERTQNIFYYFALSSNLQ